MLKLLRLFLLFAFLPSISFAWNSMCYSPVQLSAFMSKPTKSSGGVSRSSVRKVSASIDTLEEALNNAEGDLQDSLDKDKLKDKASTVAGKIRDYIEDGKDGWDCVQGGQSFLFFFPSLIPQASAETGSGDPGYNDAEITSEFVDSLFDSESESNEDSSVDESSSSSGKIGEISGSRQATERQKTAPVGESDPATERQEP
ncbi:MAG: hypothetical protein OXN83_02235, partial [Oligoflexia bacterium]|nr:hypothetical protein [Oligoflexia bacterium]